jgi:hypothetical protein
MMKSHFAIVLTGLTPFAALAISALLIALEQSGLQIPQNHHTHYKVIDAKELETLSRRQGSSVCGRTN